jgi:NADH dehydrogenase
VSKEKETILVTGASGFVGRSLMRELQQRGLPVRAYQGLVNDPLRLREEVQGAETVFHLASGESSGRERRLQHVDVAGTRNLLEASRNAGVRRLIVMSRLGADPNSVFPLLRAKGDVERMVQRSGIPYTIVRSATLFGIDDRFLNSIAAMAAWSWPLVLVPGKGDAILQPFWVEDLVQCLVLLLERPDLCDQVLELAGEERLRYESLVQIVLEAADLNRVAVKTDLRLIRPLRAMAFGLWGKPPVTSFFLQRLSVPDVAAVDSVLRTFDFRPERMVDHISYLRRRGWRRRLFEL